MSLIRGAINRPVTVSMAMAATMLFGIVSLDRLALNLLPDISYPSLTVQTDYEDAAPEEIESLLTRPIEEAVGVIPGLTRLSSVSRSGQSEVVLEFGWGTNMDLAAMETREKLDLVTLPRDAKRPVLLRFDPSNDPIMRLQLSGKMSLARLRYAAEKELKKSLESTDGVAAIKVIGGLEEQIRIEIDEKRLAELGISISEITTVLAQENLNQASGSLYDQDANYLVRILNQFKTVEEIQQIIVRNDGGRKIVLGDVARVWRGTKDREIITRLNGNESVEMAIYKEGDANTVTVAQAVTSRLELLKKSNLMPKDVSYEVVFNQADFIKASIDDLLDAAIVGGVLAILVLFLFLRDLRSTLIIGVTIPISILGTFGVMYQTGITLNLMSLGGIALGVGMLVDNSIVILESVHRHRLKGGSVKEAVFRGTSEVSMAVVASTGTSVAVFLPLIFVEGIAGQLFRDQALTITYCQIVSLLIGITLTPMILAWRMRRPVSEPDAARQSRLMTKPGMRHVRKAWLFLMNNVFVLVLTDVRRLVRFFGRVLLRVLAPLLDRFESVYNRGASYYPRFLGWALQHKGTVVAAAAGLIAVSAGMALFIGAELIPPLTQGEFSFEVKLPEGKALEQSDRVMQTLEREVMKYPEVKTVFASVGGSNKNQFARDRHEENYGQLYVVMRDKRDRAAEAQVANRIRERLAGFPEIASFTFSRPTLFSLKTPIEVEIFGFDLNQLRATADKVAKRMESVHGLSDITTSTELGNPEIQIRFDRERMARLGLDEGQISNVLRSKIRGDVASRYREDDKQIEILVRADEADRNTVQDIRDLAINIPAARPAGGSPQAQQTAAQGTPQRPGAAVPALAAAATVGVPIRLDSIADVVIDRGPAEVRRIRSQRAALVSANLSGRDLNSVSEEIKLALSGLSAEVPPGITVQLGGQNEELQHSYRSLLFALGLAVFLVYLVMASQFESLVHPFIIMFSVPLGLVGVVFSMFFTGTTFSVMVFLGIIILAGIVVNNAIVLIDYANQLRREGLPKREALMKAGEVRLRPILMTTLTSVLGLVPMALGWGEGAEIRTPMAITVIGGLLFSTFLTLVFIPVVYEIVDRKRYELDAEDEIPEPEPRMASGPGAPAPYPSAGD